MWGTIYAKRGQGQLVRGNLWEQKGLKREQLFLPPLSFILFDILRQARYIFNNFRKIEVFYKISVELSINWLLGYDSFKSVQYTRNSINSETIQRSTQNVEIEIFLLVVNSDLIISVPFCITEERNSHFPLSRIRIRRKCRNHISLRSFIFVPLKKPPPGISWKKDWDIFFCFL